MAHSKSLCGKGWAWPRPENCPDALVPVVSALNQTREYIRRAVDGLDDDGVWRRPVPSLPAIGNLLIHLRGTEHQWIGCGVGRLPLDRDRAGEFAATGGIGLADLLAGLGRTAADTGRITAELRDVDDRVLFHYSYTENHFAFHAGQLVTLRKLADPGFTLY